MNAEDRKRIEEIRERVSLLPEKWFNQDVAWALDLVERLDHEAAELDAALGHALESSGYSWTPAERARNEALRRAQEEESS